MAPYSDPDIVRREYETDELVRIRREIDEKYTVPSIDFVDWAVGCLGRNGAEQILDAGCGNGLYYKKLLETSPDLKYFGLDISPGMLKKHPLNGSSLALADARHLPYPDNSFNVVMANHMLYHVSDIDHTLTEFRRVLKPDGVLMTATNSLHNMPEFQVLLRRSIVLLTRQGAAQVYPPAAASDDFALENGSRQLSRHFFGVVRYDLPGSLVFNEVDPVMEYLESLRFVSEPQLPKDVVWDDVMMIMRQQITHLINHLDELVIKKLTGVLLASDRGGFIREYVDYKTRATVEANAD